MVKIDIEYKYLQPIKKAILNNENPYTQVVNVKPTKVFQPTVNDYNQQPINQVTENLKPLINLQQVGENTWQQVKQLGRLAWNLPSAFEVSKPDIKIDQAINQQAQSQVAPMGTGYNSQNYLSLKDSMEQKYDYALMPENTKKAYENVVDTIFRNEISGKPLAEQKAIIEELYKDKEMPEFVAKKYNTVLSQETEANLRLENAKQNLVAMVNKNVDEMNLIQKKYEGDDSLLTDFTSEVLGTVVKMTPYIAASMIAGPGGFGTVATGYMAGSTVMGTQVFTESLAQALSEGATEQQATQYAMVSALIEAGTEAISGGIPGAPKGLLSSGVQGMITDSFKDKAVSQATQVLMEKAVDVFGEGAEEALAEYLGSMALAIYREDERTDEELTADMVKSFVMGMVTSGAMQMGEYATIKIVEPLVTEKTLDVQSLPQEQVNEVLNKIALRTGVQATDGQAYVLKDLPRGQKGYIEDNQIVLNQKDVEENGLLLSALPHEMTHALENTKGYRELANFVLSQQSKSLGMSLEELKQAYQEEYQRQFDEGLTTELRIANDEEIARELVANFIRTNIATRPLKDANGDVITDDNGNIVTYRDYNALVKLSERPKALDSIKKVLRTMVARSKGTQAEDYFTELDSFIQKALVSKQSKASSDEIQFSILNDLESKNLSTMSLNGSKIARESGLTEKEQLLDYSLQKGLGYTQVDDASQPKYMLSQGQEEFFKDSKARDEQGKLLTLYHGTNAKFNEFNSNSGINWATPYKPYAEAFSNKRVITLHANIKNPIYVGNIDLVIGDENLNRLSKTTNLDINDLKKISESYNATNIFNVINTKEFRDLAIKNGYDGIKAIEGRLPSYAVFNSNQIKKTNNLNPTKSNDIRFMLDSIKKDDVDLNELKNIKYNDISILSSLNINDVTSDNKQEFWNKVEEVKQNITLTPEQVEPFNRYLTYLSNYVRDYSDLRRDNSGHLTTDQQEQDFNVRDEQGRLKVFYVQENGISDKALNYGYFLLNSPLGLDLNKTKEVYLKANLLDANGTELQSLNYDGFDLSEMTNSEVIKALGNQNSIESVYKAIQEQFGVNGLDYGDSVMVFNQDQYKSIERETELAKNVYGFGFYKDGEDYSVLEYDNYNNVVGQQYLSQEEVIEMYPNDIANAILSSAKPTQLNISLVDKVLSSPNDKVEIGDFSSERDNKNNQLTKEVVSFFKNAKVRENDGTLKVVYHGSKNQFDEFSYQYMGNNGLAYGVGFYFTDDKSYAWQHGDYVQEVYLNITKPLRDFEKTITEEQAKEMIAKFYEYMEEDINDVDYYYDLSIKGRNMSDKELFNTLIQDSGLDYEQGLRIINEVTGFDGIISSSDSGMIYIPFFPEQIKSINNPNPTQSRNIKFMIDYKPDTNSVLITKQPTQSEYSEMAKFFDNTLARQGNDIFVQIESPDGRYFDKRYSVSMPSGMIVNEIKKFFDTSKREEFFKESKARDENGNLIPLYHGTKEGGFNIFNYNPLKQTGTNYGEAYYFSSNKRVAQGYAYNLNKDSRVKDYENKRNILFENVRQNPTEENRKKYLEFSKSVDILDLLSGELENGEILQTEGSEVKNVYLNLKNPLVVDANGEYYFKVYEDYFEEAKRNGNDGIIIKNVIDVARGEHKPSDVYVAFSKNQIKNVDNYNPTSSNDIRYMLEEPEKVRQFAQSTLQGNIGKIASQKVEDDILSGKFNYQVMADKPTLEQANSTINKDGVDKSYQEFIALFNSGKRMTKLDVTKGEILIVKLANEGKIREFEEVLAAVAEIGTESGQNIQAMHMIKGLSIQGQVATLERVVERMKTKHFEDTGKRLVSKDNKEIEIPQDYKEFFTQAQMKEIQLKEQQKEFQNNQLELERLQNEIDSYVLSNKQFNTEEIRSELAQLKELQQEERRLQKTLDKKSDQFKKSQERIIELQNQIDSFSDSAFNTDELKSQLNELRDLQRQEDALNLQLLRLQKKMDTYSNENITFLKADVERAKNSLNEVESKIKEVRKAQSKYDKLSKELSESTVNIEEVKALNEQVKQVRKAQRLLDKMIAENQAYTSQENINSIMDEVKGKIAEQMPVSTMDKLNAWRYLAMLGNPRTHIRNMVGNSAMMPIVASKNLIAAGLQHFIPSEQRTTVLSVSNEAKEYAKMDYLEFGKDLMSKGKYSIKGEIIEKQRTFKWNWLENTSNFVFDALSAEDLFFKQHYYKSSLARYITAQKLDVNTITEEQITQARLHAIEEANKATFNDASALASALTRIEQNQKSAGNKVASFAMQSLIPFKKTPLNILKRGVEYSPIGLGQNLLFNLNKVKNGQMTSTQFIDGISAGLTGTGIALVGAWLYSIGVLELGGDDDETKRLSYLENALGRQRYSLKFFDQSLTIDWLAPSVMPLMVGAELQKSFLDESGESLFDRFTESLIGIMNPLFDLTMLQGVTDVLQSYSSGGAETAVDVASTMFANYINQYIPTLSGQIARMIDSTQRSTYAPKDSPSAWLETVGRRILNKIPYASFLNAPVVNVKGEPITNAENPFIRAFNVFLNPGYLKDRTETIYDTEILRLYDVTMDSGVLPRIAPKSFKLDGEEHILDNQEYATFQQTLGQTSYDLLKEYTQGYLYDSLDDSDRVKFIEDLYEYSYQKARAEYLEKYDKVNTDSGYQKIVQSELKGLEIKDYLVIKSIYDKIKDEGGEVKENFLRTIQSKGYSTNQINTFIETSTTWKIESSEPKLKTSGLKKLN